MQLIIEDLSREKDKVKANMMDLQRQKIDNFL